MIKIKKLITDLNELKERAEFIADHMHLLAQKSFKRPASGSYAVEEDFTWKSIIKLVFLGSSRLHRLIASINVVFDKIEQDIEELIVQVETKPETENPEEER